MSDIPMWPDPVDRTVLQAGRSRAVRLRRRYPAPPSEVWAAITDPKQLTAWFADVDVSDSGFGDDRAGSSWRAVFRNGAASGTIEECAAERAIVTTWRWDHEDITSILHVTLEPAGDGTLMEIEQRGSSTDYPAGYGAGWYAMLGGLAIHLDGRLPTEEDWDADFALALRTVGSGPG